MAGATAASAAYLAWAVRGRSSAVFAPSFWRGDPRRPAIALTFDDGPSESTPALLQELAPENAPPTIYQCGANVERRPHIARAVAAAGHEIGNHSHTHPYFHFRSARFMAAELERAQRAIENATGARPRWMRAPYGVRWFGLRQAQRQNGLTGVMWSVIGYDWNLTADAIVRRVSGRLAPGAIVCLHDGRRLEPHPPAGETVEAVRRLLPLIRSRGFKLLTVTQLLCPKI
jgi:peptidoglycan/xylan/chitin deacetylase (PgdA/CDA1 family)